jgi:hypothetical protein
MFEFRKHLFLIEYLPVKIDLVGSFYLIYLLLYSTFYTVGNFIEKNENPQFSMHACTIPVSKYMEGRVLSHSGQILYIICKINQISLNITNYDHFSMVYHK